MGSANFWDSNVWSFIFILAVLTGSLLLANMIKRVIPAMRRSLVPASVLGGLIVLIISEILCACTGKGLFDFAVFGTALVEVVTEGGETQTVTASVGYQMLEMITYHCLALGFIASTLKASEGKLSKKRLGEVFNTGVTTVSTYLMQAVLGFGITLLICLFYKEFFPAAGVLLPFGYGQGTGQALNYGNIYETDWGFVGGRSFGLTIAALGFLSASIGGIVHLNVLKRRGKVKVVDIEEEKIDFNEVQAKGDIPMQGSVDKLTVQIALIALCYLLTYGVMFLLSKLIPSMQATIYGFNFLIGVLMATLVKAIFKGLKKVKVIKRNYANNFLLTRTSNFFYDVMVVAGIAAIQMKHIKDYWWILLILGVVGLVSTFVYNRVVAKTLFKDYAEEQFLMMFGMLTGTASTGVILLREIDGEFKTPAADNLVYQNIPAIVFGFPLMLLASLAPKQPILTFIILVAFFLVMNIILFRNKIFKFKRKKAVATADCGEQDASATECADCVQDEGTDESPAEDTASPMDE